MALVAAAMFLAGCADLAASTGSESDQLAGAVHDEIQTVRLVAEAGLGDPEPTIPLQTVLDGVGSELSSVGEAAFAMPTDRPDREPLLDLIDDALMLTDDVRAALDERDHAALRDAISRADELTAAVAERSDLL
ncbi:hypothetical protein GCM10029992_42290 [Glycomyces albus]